MAADGCCCRWRPCCLTSGNICAAEKLQHPLGYREPRGTVVQCDPIQVQLISTVRIAVVGNPVHPLPNLMIISLLKVHWKKTVSESHLLENTVSFLFPQGRQIALWSMTNRKHQSLLRAKSLWPDAIFLLSSIRRTQTSALLPLYFKNSKDTVTSEMSHQAIRIRVYGKDPKQR